MLWLEKIFLHCKKHNKASSAQLSADLTLKAHGQNQQWHKTYKEQNYTRFSQSLTFKAQEILRIITLKKVTITFLCKVKDTEKMI